MKLDSRFRGNDGPPRARCVHRAEVVPVLFAFFDTSIFDAHECSEIFDVQEHRRESLPEPAARAPQAFVRLEELPVDLW